MKKLVWLAVAILIAYLVVLQMANGDTPAQAMNVPSRAPVTATARPTETPVPTATIDYQVTAIVAQATSDEARRINAQATADHEMILLGQSQLTAQAEANALVMLQLTAQWEGVTATAAYTSIPLTATQQAALNTQIPARQMLEAGQLTATRSAPTQIMAMQRAINYKKYGAADYFARWAIWGVVAIFLLSIVAWVLRNPVLPKPDAVQSQPAEYTVVSRKRESDRGDYQMTRLVVPCSSDQLTELAKAITGNAKTWAINQWEGKDTLFTRDVILRVRAWARDNKFAIANTEDELTTTDDGTDFLLDWLDSRELPDGYYFERVGSGEVVEHA